MAIKFVRLEMNTEHWNALNRAWRAQCESFEEEFSAYENEPIGVVRELVEGPRRNDAGAFALHDGTRYGALCQLNRTTLPGFSGPVLRVRMLYLAPHYEFGDYNIEEYSRLLIEVFNSVIHVSNCEMRSRHIKFHLRSPADRQFFAAFGSALDDTGVFESVGKVGSWLHITKRETQT